MQNKQERIRKRILFENIKFEAFHRDVATQSLNSPINRTVSN